MEWVSRQPQQGRWGVCEWARLMQVVRVLVAHIHATFMNAVRGLANKVLNIFAIFRLLSMCKTKF